MELIAHRGSSYLAPENTLAAFRLGWEETTTCELDLQMSRDGRFLVLHDASTGRTTGVDLQVHEHSWSDLRQLDAGLWKGEAWRGERIPLLEDVLAELPRDKQLLIEIKGGSEMISRLAGVLENSDKQNQLLLQSFDLETCRKARKQLPTLPVYFLVHSRLDPDSGRGSTTLNDAFAQALAADLSGINPNDSALVDAALVHKIQAAGRKVFVWTVDQPEAAQRLLQLGVDGIITNRPGWLRKQLAGFPPVAGKA